MIGLRLRKISQDSPKLQINQEKYYINVPNSHNTQLRNSRKKSKIQQQIILISQSESEIQIQQSQINNNKNKLKLKEDKNMQKDNPKNIKIDVCLKEKNHAQEQINLIYNSESDDSMDFQTQIIQKMQRRKNRQKYDEKLDLNSLKTMLQNKGLKLQNFGVYGTNHIDSNIPLDTSTGNRQINNLNQKRNLLRSFFQQGYGLSQYQWFIGDNNKCSQITKDKYRSLMYMMFKNVIKIIEQIAIGQNNIKKQKIVLLSCKDINILSMKYFLSKQYWISNHYKQIITQMLKQTYLMSNKKISISRKINLYDALLKYIYDQNSIKQENMSIKTRKFLNKKHKFPNKSLQQMLEHSDSTDQQVYILYLSLHNVKNVLSFMRKKYPTLNIKTNVIRNILRKLVCKALKKLMFGLHKMISINSEEISRIANSIETLKPRLNLLKMLRDGYNDRLGREILQQIYPFISSLNQNRKCWPKNNNNQQSESEFVDEYEQLSSQPKIDLYKLTESIKKQLKLQKLL